MPITIHKPTSAGRRISSANAFAEITTDKPKKSLTVASRRISGRNNQGKITVRHRGGGAKRRYRMVDFKQNILDIPAKVQSIEYDPHRSAWIALIAYANGVKSYILAAQDLKVGATVIVSKSRVDITPGNRMPIDKMPVGTMIYNVELNPGQGGMIVRSAGSVAQIVAVEGKFATLRLPSKEIRKVPRDSMASVGMVSNPDNRLVRYGKAGRMRHLGFRPTVRGKAMNPVDHPHGGGEGHNPIGMKHPKTPWGKPALGVRTRKPTKHSWRLIVSRRPRNMFT
jgi:large subunit ribosomal protein L2